MHHQITLTDTKLDTWIKLNQNVLLIGEHGVGKTAQIISAFERNFGEINKDWVILSGANLDPWVDLIGIPKVHQNGNGEYLDFVRPQNICDETLQAIFLDEANRCAKPVRNAVMELIQFKSINGRKFPKLKVVWAAINPEKDGSSDEEDDFEYDVEKLDPAQKDRFHVIVSIPYKPSITYFKNKYGNLIGEQMVKWWEKQPNNAKKMISPRRLDYATEYFKAGGNVRDVLPNVCNINKFVEMANVNPVLLELKKLIKSGDEKKLQKFLADDNNYEESIDYIRKQASWVLKYAPEEKLSKEMDADEKLAEEIITNCCEKGSMVEKVVDEKIKTGNKKFEELKKKYHGPITVTGSTLVIKTAHTNNGLGKQPFMAHGKSAHSYITYEKFQHLTGIYSRYNPKVDKKSIPTILRFVLDCLVSFQRSTIDSTEDRYLIVEFTRQFSLNHSTLIVSLFNTLVVDCIEDHGDSYTRNIIRGYTGLVKKLKSCKNFADNCIIDLDGLE